MLEATAVIGGYLLGGFCFATCVTIGQGSDDLDRFIYAIIFLFWPLVLIVGAVGGVVMAAWWASRKLHRLFAKLK